MSSKAKLFLGIVISIIVNVANAAPNCNNILAPKSPLVIAGNEVQFEGKTYPHLIYDHYVESPGSFMIRPKGDRIENLRNTKKYVILLHGVGADVSNPDSMLHQHGNYAGTILPGSKASYQKRQIINHELFQEGIYSEILPLPGSTYGGKDIHHAGNSIDLVLTPLKRHIEEVRKHLPKDAEVIVHGRSYGATIAAALSHKYPSLVDKNVLVGLAVPRADIMAEVEVAIRRVEDLGKIGQAEAFDQNWAWTHWFNRLVVQVKWFDVPKIKNLFGGTKTLILIGEKDFQVTDTERMIYGDMALKSSHVQFHLVPGAEHDATKTKYNGKPQRRMGVYGNMLAFDFIFNR